MSGRLDAVLRSRSTPWLVVVVGAGLLVGAARYVDSSDQYWADLLLGLGTAIFLVLPLAILQRSLGQRVEQAETEAKQIRQDVGEVREAVAALSPEAITSEVLARVEATRAPDRDLLVRLKSGASTSALLPAFRRWVELDFVSVKGLRQELRHTGIFWRLRPNDDGGVDSVIESWRGEEVETSEWDPSVSITDHGAAIAELLRRYRVYPGDTGFSFGETISEIIDALDLAYRLKSGDGRHVTDHHPIIQVFGPQWLITDYGLESIDHPYQIDAPRLLENDPPWTAHMQTKGWVDQSCFFKAYDVACELWKRNEWDHMTWRDPAWMGLDDDEPAQEDVVPENGDKIDP